MINFNKIINLNQIDFLNILTSTVLVETIMLFMFRYTKSFFSVKAINDWYDNLNWSAIILDILIVMIVFYINIYFCKYFKINSYYQILFCQLAFQIIHDLIFYFFFIKKIPQGESPVWDEFKSYAKNTGIGAIFGDSYMYLLGIPILMKTLKLTNDKLIFISLCCIYIIGYFIYQKPLYKYKTLNLEFILPFII